MNHPQQLEGLFTKDYVLDMKQQATCNLETLPSLFLDGTIPPQKVLR